MGVYWYQQEKQDLMEESIGYDQEKLRSHQDTMRIYNLNIKEKDLSIELGIGQWFHLKMWDVLLVCGNPYQGK